MNLSPQEQANACYFLRKVRQQEFARKVGDTANAKLEDLQVDWAHLEELFIEEARLYKIAQSSPPNPPPMPRK